MSRRDARVTLRQIAEYGRHAQAICEDKSAHEIAADWREAFAFERVMEVLGEAVKRLPEDLKRRHPDVPWQLVAGMRDKISHGYDSVDQQVLWDAVRNDLPVLLKAVEQMGCAIDPSQES
jgi:uncharacterized protein with HEPN domain